jgi:hypothetical protein
MARSSAIAIATLLIAAPAASAKAPSVKTLKATGITQTTALMRAEVNPNGEATSYFFDIGLDKSYGNPTPATTLKAGTKGVLVRQGTGSLKPDTVYHYRLVATNASGTTRGADVAFRTAKQPRGFVIGGAPNPVVFGDPVGITGTVTGSDNANQPVRLQSRTFPYTSNFTNQGNVQLTDANGVFHFVLSPFPMATQFRAITRNNLTSPIVLVGVKVDVTLRASRRKRGAVRMSGLVRPALPTGTLVSLQRRRAGRWVTIGRAALHNPTPGGALHFAKTFKHLRRPSRIRALVKINDGAHLPNHSTTVRVG